MSLNTKISQCSFQHVEYTKDEVQAICPWLTKVDNEFLGFHNHVPYKSSVVRAGLATEQQVAPLLDYALQPNKPLILISLPPCYEANLEQVVSKQPGFTIAHALSLRAVKAFVSWFIETPSGRFGFSMSSDIYSELIHWKEPVLEGQLIGFPSRRHSIIALSGNRVLVGGLWITDDEMFICGMTETSAGWWRASDFHTEEEISLNTDMPNWPALNHVVINLEDQSKHTSCGDYFDFRGISVIHTIPEVDDTVSQPMHVSIPTSKEQTWDDDI